MKVYESKDKAGMTAFVRLISNSKLEIKMTEVHEASASLRFFEGICARLNSVCDKELGTKEDFGVTIQRLPDAPGVTPPTEEPVAEAPKSAEVKPSPKEEKVQPPKEKV